MASFEGWHIYLVDGDGETEITNFVLGFSTREVTNIGSPSTVDATVTLNNNDGRFTPAEGGGTGAFRLTDWLSKALKIKGEFDYSPAPLSDSLLVSLPISNVSFSEDGINSQMTIEAQDWLSLTSSALADISAGSTVEDLWRAIDLAADSSDFDLVFPQLGLPSYTAYPFIFPGTVSRSELKFVDATGVSFLDYINQAFLRAAPGMLLPQDIEIRTSSSSILYFGWVIDRTLTNTGFLGVVPDLLFSESPADGVMAFSEVMPGFNFDDITSRSTITSAATGVSSQTSTNATTGGLYGTRTRTSSGTGNASDADALTAAEFWTKRQGTSRYVARELRTSLETIFANNTGNATGESAYFIVNYSSLWNPCKITYTPVGGEQVDEVCVISGRRVDAVPGRTDIALELLSAHDYQSLTLDNALLGALGGVSDSYDESSHVYDEIEFYDGRPVSGFRLG